MPQVPKAARKERAARLRALGAERAAAYLARQAGRTHRVLMEKPRTGRTETFAEVAFAADRPEGEIITTAITGATAERLLA